MTLQDAIWVFAGPSLPPASRPPSPTFEWRGPAMAGDGFAALEGVARAVVLIDGLFDRFPAIKHKELLALIENGVPVFGAASMGALRAAELAPCGMIGVGAIFEAYSSGRLTGDDEVAVLHGPAEMAWASLTLPLVNVRATLVRAVREGVIRVSTARALRTRAAGVFFQDRTWRALAEAAGGHASAEELERFFAWAPGGYVDLKQRDALRCLAGAAAHTGPSGRTTSAPSATVFTERLLSQVSQGLKPDPA